MTKKKIVHFYTDPHSTGGPTTYIGIITKSDFLCDYYDFDCTYQMKALNKLRVNDIRRIVNEIKASKADILHVHGLQGEGFIGVLCGKLAGVKNVLVTVHGMQHDSFNTKGIKKLVFKHGLEKWTLWKADAVFCVCEAAEKSAYISQNTRHLLPYLHNCVSDMPAYDREIERKKLGYESNDTVIVSVGRITEGKGAAVLLDIILQDNASHHKYLVLGDGNYLPVMKEKLSTQIRSGKVIFTGAVSDVGRYLSASDLYVSTSYKENLSISILEAGYYGLPSLVTRVGGNGEIIQSGVNGELYAVEDIQGFFENLRAMESNGLAAYGGKAKQIITERFSIRVFEEGLKRIYDSITEL